MFRQLDFLLSELALKLKDFDLFAVTAGPGSFTGLRVGLTAVKGWAEVYRKPVAAVSGLEAVAAQSQSVKGLLVPVLDARRGQFYFGFYRRRGSGLELDGGEWVMTPPEFIEKVRHQTLSQAVTIVATEPEVITAIASGLEPDVLSTEHVCAALAPVVAQLGFRQAQQGKLLDALRLDANYVRRSDAELHWKGP